MQVAALSGMPAGVTLVRRAAIPVEWRQLTGFAAGVCSCNAMPHAGSTPRPRRQSVISSREEEEEGQGRAVKDDRSRGGGVQRVEYRGKEI